MEEKPVVIGIWKEENNLNSISDQNISTAFNDQECPSIDHIKSEPIDPLEVDNCVSLHVIDMKDDLKPGTIFCQPDVSLADSDNVVQSIPIQKTINIKEESIFTEPSSGNILKDIKIEVMDEGDLVKDICEEQQVDNYFIKEEVLEELDYANIELKSDCHFCKYECNNEKVLKKHILEDHANYVMCFSCPHCPYKSRKGKSDLLIKHIMSKHTVKQKYTCDYCLTKFTKKKLMSSHIKTCHGDTQMYSCEECDFVCNFKKDLTTHKKEKHPKCYMFMCPLCTYKSVRKSDLKVHVTGTHNTEKPFKCNLCDYKTGRRGDLRSHVRGCHNTSRPIMCPHCPYRTNRRGDLKTHIFGRHSSGRAIECKLCDYQTVWRSRYCKHMKKEHSSIIDNES